LSNFNLFKFSQKLSELCSRFYTIIPHDFGFRHPPLIRTKQELKQKLEMVESLAEIQIASNLMQAMANNSASTACHPVDSYYLTLRNEIRPIHQQSPEYQLIERYVDATHGPTHRMRVHIRQVYGVQRHGEQERFHPVANRLKNRMLLWHGSRLSNWVGILSQGLRIAPPEAPVTGYMFGKGIYFADMVTKSANYCCTNGSNRRALLVLCEVALGRVREYLNSCYDASQPCTGPNSTADSTKGLGKNVPDQQEWQHMADGQVVVPCGKPVTTNLNGALLYNEYIVYSTDQCCMRYLVEVDILHQ
jgi:poly [ADP-ribose] polymerase